MKLRYTKKQNQLIDAIEYGNTSLVKSLIDEPHIFNNDYIITEALNLAQENNKIQIFNLILNKLNDYEYNNLYYNILIELLTSYEYEVLEEESSNKEYIISILKYIYIDFELYENDNSLSLAIHSNDYSIQILLLQKGVNIEHNLWYSSITNDIHMIQMIMDYSPHDLSINYNKTFYLSVRYKNYYVSRLLMDNINIKSLNNYDNIIKAWNYDINLFNSIYIIRLVVLLSLSNDLKLYIINLLIQDHINFNINYEENERINYKIDIINRCLNRENLQLDLYTELTDSRNINIKNSSMCKNQHTFTFKD